MKKLSILLAIAGAIIFITSCKKEYSLESGIDHFTPWGFNEGGKEFKGTFVDVYQTTRVGTGDALVFVGTTPATSDTIMVTQLSFPGGIIKPGTYSTSSPGNGFYVTDSRDTAHPVFLYVAEPRSVGTDVKFVVENYDRTTGFVSGSFSGTAINQANLPVVIEKGRFNTRVRQ